MALDPFEDYPADLPVTQAPRLQPKEWLAVMAALELARGVSMARAGVLRSVIEDGAQSGELSIDQKKIDLRREEIEGLAQAEEARAGALNPVIHKLKQELRL